jgi:hypothetical protein
VGAPLLAQLEELRAVFFALAEAVSREWQGWMVGKVDCGV